MNQPPNDRPNVHSAPKPREADPGHLVQRALAILAEQGAVGPQARPSDFRSRPVVKNDDLPDPLVEHRVLSDGTAIQLPIRYYDNQCLIATFLADLGRAGEMLKGTGLKPVEQEDGKAVVAFGCFEYRKTDIGAYNEIGLVVSAMAAGDPIPGLYVVNLPVNTSFADRVGQEIWGYNKFIASIEIKSDRKIFSMAIRDPDHATLATLEVRRGSSIPMAPTDMLTFSLLDGNLLKTLIRVLTPFQVSYGDDFLLKVGPSQHAMAQNLRTLGLDRARPLMVQFANPFKSALFPGRLL